MVGVAGGSKSCRTCKLRRKGCDYRRPSCLRCVQGGFECGGYNDSDRVVVYEANPSRAPLRLARTAKRALGPSALMPSLRNSALRSVYLDAAWRTLQPSKGKPFQYSWLSELPAAYHQGMPLHFAFTAVALARVGQQSGDNDLLRQSIAAHQKALVAIRKSLFTVPPTEDLIAGVLVLAAYETIAGSPKERLPSMIAHTSAAQELVKAHGSFILASPTGSKILKDLRQQAFLEALGSRTPCRFASEVMPMQSTKDQLLCIIAAIPDVMQRIDRCKTVYRTQLATRDVDTIYSELLSIVDRLDQWHRSSVPTDSFCLEPFGTKWHSSPERLAHAFLLKRRYSSVAIAEPELIYANVQLMIHLELFDFICFVSSIDAHIVEHDLNSTPKPEHIRASGDLTNASYAFQEAKKYLGVILESIEYFLEQEAGVLAASSTLLPTLMATTFMQRMQDPRVDCLLALVTDYQRRTSVPLADLVNECLERGTTNEGETVRWKKMI